MSNAVATPISTRAYTSGEAARICGLSLSTLKRWIMRGVLRAYRTPGGDLRVTPEHLRDFMREYDIPLSRLEREEPKVLVFIKNAVLRRQIVKSVYKNCTQAQVELVESELDLGLTVGSFRPWAVVLEGLDSSEVAGVCTRVRDYLAPETVRIGLINDETADFSGRNRPDVVVGSSGLDYDHFTGALLAQVPS